MPIMYVVYKAYIGQSDVV